SVLSPKTRWILGADTVVVYRGRVLGKPRSRGDAFRMLSALAGKEHRVYTGVALWDRKTGRWRTGVSETRVRIRAMAASAIRDYFSRVDPMDKAGAYGIQEGPRIVEQVDGSYTNVVGLPVELLRRMAAETGMLKGAGPRRVKKTSARSRACRYLPSKARASRG
ncbi:MAG: Maf family protein, partial [Candidatus Omnitrophota bacterium]